MLVRAIRPPCNLSGVQEPNVHDPAAGSAAGHGTQEVKRLVYIDFHPNIDGRTLGDAITNDHRADIGRLDRLRIDGVGLVVALAVTRASFPRGQPQHREGEFALYERRLRGVRLLFFTRARPSAATPRPLPHGYRVHRTPRSGYPILAEVAPDA